MDQGDAAVGRRSSGFHHSVGVPPRPPSHHHHLQQLIRVWFLGGGVQSERYAPPLLIQTKTTTGACDQSVFAVVFLLFLQTISAEGPHMLASDWIKGGRVRGRSHRVESSTTETTQLTNQSGGGFLSRSAAFVVLWEESEKVGGVSVESCRDQN